MKPETEYNLVNAAIDSYKNGNPPIRRFIHDNFEDFTISELVLLTRFAILAGNKRSSRKDVENVLTEILKESRSQK